MGGRKENITECLLFSLSDKNRQIQFKIRFMYAKGEKECERKSVNKIIIYIIYYIKSRYRIYLPPV